MTLQAIRAEIDKLPRQQRLDFLADLADDLEAETEGPTLLPAERTELLARLEQSRAAPQAGLSWQSIRHEVESKP